jgi:hypothetical protein
MYSQVIIYTTDNIPVVQEWWRVVHDKVTRSYENTVELGYNDIGLCDTSSVTSDILWYQLIPHF